MLRNAIQHARHRPQGTGPSSTHSEPQSQVAESATHAEKDVGLGTQSASIQSRLGVNPPIVNSQLDLWILGGYVLLGAGAARSEGGDPFKLLGPPPRGDGSSQGGGSDPPLEVMVHVRGGSPGPPP